jgi:hypothetical protein
MPVRPTGIRADGEMALPDDPDRLGWYRYGPAPGAAAGSAVLAGHVDSVEEGVGPLSVLTAARPGQRVLVRLADGSVRRYVVVGVERIAQARLPVDTLFARDGQHRLSLVTCGGRYLPDAGGYEDNVVVTALPERMAG